MSLLQGQSAGSLSAQSTLPSVEARTNSKVIMTKSKPKQPTRKKVKSAAITNSSTQQYHETTQHASPVQTQSISPSNAGKRGKFASEITDVTSEVEKVTVAFRSEIQQL